MRGLALAVVLGVAAAHAADGPPGDAYERERCGTPSCHNSVRPWSGSGVRLNEFRVWRDRDRHRHAYDVLFDDRARTIAARLGTPAAERRPDCLGCHAAGDAEPRNVGCETCHGMGEWVARHARRNASHADNVQNGLRPLDDPRERARLCVSCHVGDDRRGHVTHRLLAAGHPRLSFDLDSLSANQPAHYRTHDYPARAKQASASVQLWAVGQCIALARRLDDVAAAVAPGTPWPELAVFDCRTCHHAIGTPSGGMPLGRPRLDVGSAVAYGRALALVDPPAADALARDTAALAAAVARRDARAAGLATGLAGRVGATCDTVARATPDAARVLVALAAPASADELRAYTSAEQLYLAAQSALVTLKRTRGLPARRLHRAKRAIDALYEAVRVHDAYDPVAFRAAQSALRAALAE